MDTILDLTLRAALLVLLCFSVAQLIDAAIEYLYIRRERREWRDLCRQMDEKWKDKT